MKKAKLDVLLLSAAYPPVTGGVSSHVFYLARALSQLTKGRADPGAACTVHVVAATGGKYAEGTPPSLIVHNLPGEKGHFDTRGEVPIGNAAKYVMDNWWHIRADVVHAHDFESLHIGLLVKAAFGSKLVFTVHKTPKEWEPTLPQRDVKDCFLQLMLVSDMLDALVAPSKACEGRLLDQGFPREKVKVIPHGVPVEWLRSRPDIDGALQKLKLQPGDELILCPARLDPHKGIETFIEAAAMVRGAMEDRPIVFAIAGAGSEKYRQRLEEQARSLSVADWVRFGVFDHSEMPTLYRRAKVCVLASRRENLPQVLLEAFVFGTATVPSNTGGIPDIIDAGSTGLLFKRDEPHDLAAQLGLLLRDDTSRFLLANEAYRKAERRFNDERMADDYFRLYKKVTGIRLK